MFHRTCLASFEKFIQAGERMCPICRTSNYQKKMTRKGTQAFEGVCTVKIQALWRGFSARAKFRTGLRSFYRQRRTNGQRSQRTKFYQQELTSLADRLTQEVHTRGEQVDVVLSSMDHTLMESRHLDALFENMLMERRAYSNLGAGSESDYDMYDHESPLSSASPVRKSVSVLSNPEWKATLVRTLSRGIGDCAICMGILKVPKIGGTVNCADRGTRDRNCNSDSLGAEESGIGGATGAARRVILLSCSHLFHSSCICNFEKFSMLLEVSNIIYLYHCCTKYDEIRTFFTRT